MWLKSQPKFHISLIDGFKQLEDGFLGFWVFGFWMCAFVSVEHGIGPFSAQLMKKIISLD
jgi:hypothetical protein